MYNQSQNIFNNIFAGLAQQSRKIYDKYGFIYPDNLLGLDAIGVNLTASAI